MKRFSIFFLLLLTPMLVACITIVVSPTSTPAASTGGVTPPVPPTQAPAQPTTCIAWNVAASHIDETTCVRGTVTFAGNQGSTFFINFDNSNQAFYAVSFKHTWDDVRGKCVEISGKIASFRGRPQIVIEDKEQLSICK